MITDYHATFNPELQEDQHTKLVVDGRIRQDKVTPWWFRKVEGLVPKDTANPNQPAPQSEASRQAGNGKREKELVFWRKLTDDIEQDNLPLGLHITKRLIIEATL